MINRFKRVFASVLSVAILVSVLNLPGINSFVRADVLESGYIAGFKYQYNTETMTASVLEYSANEPTGDVTVPSQVEINDETYSVVALLGAETGLAPSFVGKKNVQSVTLPDSITFIGQATFSGSSITSINIPSGVSEIPGGAFAGCTSLSSVSLSDGLTSIGYQSFAGCSSLSSLTLPGSIESVDAAAFDSCGNLTINASCSLYSVLSGLTLSGSSKIEYIHDNCGVWQDSETYICSNTEEELEIPYIARCVGHSLTLDGKIGVDFYYTFSEELISAPGAHITISLPNGDINDYLLSAGTTQEVTLDDGTVVEAYIYSGYVAAKEMADIVEAKVIVPVTDEITWESTSATYSVNSYLSSSLNMGDNDLVNLVARMLAYGSYAQLYFEHNMDHLAAEVFTEEMGSYSDFTYSDSDFESICQFGAEYAEVQGERVQLVGSDLSLESGTSLGLYFSAVDESVETVEFKCNGVTYVPRIVRVDGEYYYYIEIENIAAVDLIDTFVVSVFVNGEADSSISYSPMSYCYLVLTSETVDNDLQNLIWSLYGYARYSYMYFEN